MGVRGGASLDFYCEGNRTVSGKELRLRRKKKIEEIIKRHTVK